MSFKIRNGITKDKHPKNTGIKQEDIIQEGGPILKKRGDKYIYYPSQTIETKQLLNVDDYIQNARKETIVLDKFIYETEDIVYDDEKKEWIFTPTRNIYD